MTTRLNKTVERMVTLFDGRQLVVGLSLAGITMRNKGERTEFLLPYANAHLRAVTLQVNADLAAQGVAAKPFRAKRGLL